MTIEKHVLDAMVQGQDVNHYYWKQLLSEPDADKLWFDAIERRRQIDKFSLLVSIAPALASALQSTRRLMRNLADIVGIITVTPQLDPLSYSLSDSDEVAAAGKIEIHWNQERIEELPPGLRLSFASEALKCWYYQMAASEGWLVPGNEWEVEAGDGPVLLLFFDHDVSSLNIRDALATASNRAVLTIIPAS